MTLSRFSRLRRCAVMGAAGACVATAAIPGYASAAPSPGMPRAAAGAHYLGWSSDVEATCLFSRSFAVTTGQQIDVTLPDDLKARSFSVRPWMKIVSASGSRWVTQGWKTLARSDDNGYPIKFTWNVSGRQADFYPAIEMYFPNERVHAFTVATTKIAGQLNGGGTEPCHMGG